MSVKVVIKAHLYTTRLVVRAAERGPLKNVI